MYQLFLCLAVFCQGSMQDKARFCFQMFDADDSGELEPEELTQFIRSIIDALFLVGEVAVRPQPATIEHLAAWCFKVRRCRDDWHHQQRAGPLTSSCQSLVLQI